METTPDAGQNIITRGLPKTGQVTQYRAGDDGQYEAGWWRGRLNANNRDRFIIRTIIVNGGVDVVLDRATGLMWPRDLTAAGANNGNLTQWNPAIDWALALDFAGFTDWRLPNILELFSLATQAGAAPLIWGVFQNCRTGTPYWSSTTLPLTTDEAWTVNFATGGNIVGAPKGIASQYMIAVRKGI